MLNHEFKISVHMIFKIELESFKLNRRFLWELSSNEKRENRGIISKNNRQCFIGTLSFPPRFHI